MPVTFVPEVPMRTYSMAFKIVRKLETGEILSLSTCDDLKQAMHLVASLAEFWPGDYSIRDSLSDTEIDFASDLGV